MLPDHRCHRARDSEAQILVVWRSRRSELQRPGPHTGSDSQERAIFPQGRFGREGALTFRETVAHIDAAEGGLGGHPRRGGGGNGHYYPRDPRLYAHLGVLRENTAEVVFVAGTSAASDLLQVDLSNATLDIDIQNDVGTAVGIVHVRPSLPLESLGVDLAQAALGFRPHANLAGQQHRCLANSALYAGVEILFIIASEVHRGSSCPHLDLDSPVNARLSRSRSLSPAPICTRRSIGTSSLKRRFHSLRALPPRRTPPPLPCLTLSSPVSPTTS